MSLIFNEYQPRLESLIFMFIREADRILNSKTDFETRVALLEKWSWVLNGLGYPHPVDNPEDLTPDDVVKRVRDMLKWVAMRFKARRM